jgi:hypothetical protein
MKTFLVFLDRVPEYPKTFINEIPIDEKCLEILQEI